MSEQTKEITEQGGAVSNVANEAEAKFKRTVVALTVGAVLLLSVLIMLMCYQLIMIGGKNHRKAELLTAIAELDEQYGEGEEIIEVMQKKWWIEQRARELGYGYADDH